MNFFFHTRTDHFDSTLTIPKFQNSAVMLEGLALFSVRILDEKWKVSKHWCEENKNFFISSDKKIQNDIYFLATEKEAIPFS